MMMPLPLELLTVISEGAVEVQGAANGFGELVSCVIRIAPEREGGSPLLLTYANREWLVEVVPTTHTPE